MNVYLVVQLLIAFSYIIDIEISIKCLFDLVLAPVTTEIRFDQMHILVEKTKK